MIDGKVHKIQQSLFILNYENRSIASRCNSILEEAFKWQLAPEIEHAIEKSVPTEAFLSISKLVIDVGDIREEDLVATLINKLKTLLPQRLHEELSLFREKEPLSEKGQKETFERLLTNAIEVFLLKGYLPHWISGSISFEGLLLKSLRTFPEKRIQLFKKYAGNKVALKRLIHTLSTESRQELLQTIEPIQTSWIIDYRVTISEWLKDSLLLDIRERKLLETLDYYILSFLLQPRIQNFDKVAFSRFVLLGIIKAFNLESEHLMSSLIRKNGGRDSLSALLKTLRDSQRLSEKLPQEIGPKELSGDVLLVQLLRKDIDRASLRALLKTLRDSQRLSEKFSQDIRPKESMGIDLLVQLLNEDNLTVLSIKKLDLKLVISAAIQNDRKRAILIHGLSKKGFAVLLKQFYQGDVPEVLTFITGFVAVLRSTPERTEKPLKIEAALLLATIDFLLEQPATKIFHTDHILFCLAEAKIQLEEIRGPGVQKFLIKYGIDSKLFSSRGELQKKESLEIARLQRTIQKKRSGIDVSQKFDKKYENSPRVLSQNILEHYLKTGMLPKGDEVLFKEDVREMFIALLNEKNTFFIQILSSEVPSRVLLSRIRSLYSNTLLESIDAYFLALFDMPYKLFLKLEFELGFETPTTSELRRAFVVESIIIGLLESEGGKIGDVLDFSFRKLINAQLNNNTNSNVGGEEVPNHIKKTPLDVMLSQEFGQLQSAVENYGKKQYAEQLVLYHLIVDFFAFEKIDRKAFREFLGHVVDDLINILERLHRITKPVVWKKIQNLLRLSSVVFNAKIQQFMAAVEDANYEISKEVFEAEIKTHYENKITKSLTILAFYIQHGFLPWWSDFLSIYEMFNSLNDAAKLDAVFVEKWLLKYTSVVSVNMISRKLPKNELKLFYEFVTPFESLRDHIVHFKNAPQGFSIGTLEKRDFPLTEELEIKGIERLLESDNLNADVLYTLLYHIEDQQLLQILWKEDQESRATIKNYLSLSKELVFYGIAYSKWRTIVYEFLFQNMKGVIGSSLDVQFPMRFVHYLKTRHSNTDWEIVLIETYSKSVQNKTEIGVKFPKELGEMLAVKKKQKVTAVYENEKIMVSNSGLIILWPFITIYFERLGYMKNDTFVSKELRNRAVYALQYLAYGRIDFLEYNLTLNKMLVGMPLEWPLETVHEISEKEMELSKSLLNGLIQNWPKVNNSTTEAIQESFLQRDGLIRIQHDQIALEVEKKGIDILMAEIPWNLSLIKLPWMEKPLHINWV